MVKDNPVARARELAVQAHGDKLHGEQFFLDHLDEVAALVVSFGERHQLLAYLLHIEEGSPVAVRISADFSEDVARQAALLSDPADVERKEREKLTNEKLAGVDPSTDGPVLVVRVADRLLDVRRCVEEDDRGRLRAFRREHGAFSKAARHAGLADELWEELSGYIRPSR